MTFFFRTIIAWRRFILLCGLAGALVMTAVALVLPPWYRARTTLLPPDQAVGFSSPEEIVERLASPLLGTISTGSSPADVCIEIMRSRAVGEPIIEEFGLMRVYGAGSMQECLDALHSHCAFASLENGMLVVTFEDRDPKRAARVANRLAEQLDEVTRGLKLSRAGRVRAFLEERMAEHKEMLATAENDVREFQQRNQTVDLDEQITAAFDLTTTLAARAIALEIELETLAHYTGPNSEAYLREKSEYAEVVKQLGRLKNHGHRDGDETRAFLPALADLPELMLEQLRLQREVEIQNKIYKLLVAQYEKAGIEEARDVPAIQVLDPALPPTVRTRPDRLRLIVAGFALDLLLGSALALVLTAWGERLPATRAARDLLAPIAADFARLRLARSRGRARS